MPHCYDREGNPHFDLTPAKAKKEGLYFSVTEIQKIESAPGLEMWKQNSMIEEAYNNGPKKGESLKDFQRRVKNAIYGDDSASNLGTRIHDGIESVLTGVKTLKQINIDLMPFVTPAVNYFNEKGFELEECERVVINTEEGYAGTADIIAHTKGGQPFILDWKSTKKIPSSPYPGQPEQISAYACAQWGQQALNNHEVWGANAYISTTEFDDDGMAKFRVHSYKPSKLEECYETFKIVNALWRIRNKYDPRS